MTVGDLKKILEKIDDDREIWVKDSNDSWNFIKVDEVDFKTYKSVVIITEVLYDYNDE